MKTQMNIKILDWITYLFIALFIYTAASKLMTLSAFEKVLSKVPLIGNFSHFIAWTVPVLELVIGALLIIPFTKKLGLYAALGLMLVFTAYLGYMFLSMPAEDLPCSCGGVVSLLSWQQHIWFNLGFVGLGITGLILYKKQKKLRA